MKKPFLFILCFSIIFQLTNYYLLFAANSQNAKGTLQGRVLDAETKEPLPGANIILKGTTMGTISNQDGYFNLKNIPLGQYTILVSMIGYKTGFYKETPIRANRTTELQVELTSTVLSAPEVIVTASKSIQRVEDSPISVAVISNMQIRQKNSITIQDALRYTPGLYLTDDQVNIRGSTGYNKGAGSRVLVLIDGVPAIAGDTGGINWDVLPPTEIAQIEVVKGAGSALYGSNALGGVINIITRDPSPQPSTRTRTSWGFYDDPFYNSWEFTNRMLHFNAIDVSHSRRIGNLGMLLSVGRKTSTGYRENGHYTLWNAFGKFQYHLSAESHFTLLTNYAFNNHGYVVTWKGPATNNPLEMPPENIGDNIHSGKFLTHLTYKTMLLQNMALISKSSIYRNHWQDYFHDNDDYAETYKLQQELQMEYQPIQKHSITGGMELTYHKTHSSLFSNPYTYDIAAYLQDEFKLSSMFRLTAGARYDHHQVRDQFSEDQLSPKFGLVFQSTPLTSVRLSAGKGFRAASIAEIFTHTIVSGFRVVPNLDLRAESVQSYEIGIHKMLGNHWIVDAAYFRNHYHNMIEPTLFIDIISLVPQPTIHLENLAETRIQGFECSTKADLLNRHLILNLGYTYLDAERLGEIPTTFTMDDFSYQPSRALAYRPTHLVQASVKGKYNRYLLGVDYRYISRFKEVLAYIKDERVPQRVLDIYGEVNVTEDLKLSFRASNLLNYHYTEVERNLAPIRHFTFTVNGSF